MLYIFVCTERRKQEEEERRKREEEEVTVVFMCEIYETLKEIVNGFRITMFFPSQVFVFIYYVY